MEQSRHPFPVCSECAPVLVIGVLLSYFLRPMVRRDFLFLPPPSPHHRRDPRKHRGMMKMGSASIKYEVRDHCDDGVSDKVPPPFPTAVKILTAYVPSSETDGRGGGGGGGGERNVEKLDLRRRRGRRGRLGGIIHAG